MLNEVKIVAKLHSSKSLWKKGILMKLHVFKSKYFQRIMSVKKELHSFNKWETIYEIDILIFEMSVCAVLDKPIQILNTSGYSFYPIKYNS